MADNETTLTPEDVKKLLTEFMTRERQTYVGMRYVPKFADPIAWDSDTEYEPLTMVTHNDAIYVSKFYVPADVDISETEYWALWGSLGTGVIDFDALTDAVRSAYVRTFDTVSDMQAATDLLAGMTCHTNGFHASGDGGAAYYTVSATGTANGMDVLALQNSLYATLVVTKPYVTPEMFGAYGDGTHDDSDVLAYVLANNKVCLSNTYYVTKTLFSSISELTINIFGHQTHDVWYDLTDMSSCILVEDGVTLFSDVASVCGIIDGISIIGKGADGQTSETMQYIFSGCTLRNVRFENSFVYNMEAVFLNSSCSSNTVIRSNTFLSCYYFFKTTDTSYFAYFNDCLLDGNYINGGSKYNNNACFQLNTLSNSVVTNNFIDFYRSIYDPSLNGARNTEGDLAITSIGNRYEAFRYFVYTPTFNSNRRVIASFIGDMFTHIDVNRATSFNLDRYEKQVMTYSDVDYEIEPYLLYIYSNSFVQWQVTFRDVKFAADAFVDGAPFNCTGNSPFSGSHGCKLVFEYSKYSALLMPDLFNAQNDKVTFYGNNDNFLTTNFFKVLTEAPDVTAGYNKGYLPGATYIYNNVSYKCVKFFQSIWKIAFIDALGNVTYRQT